MQTKTVAQCVEFYYTYKKQVKIGRNGILTFGPPDSPMEKHTEAVVDVKVQQSLSFSSSGMRRSEGLYITWSEKAEVLGSFIFFFFVCVRVGEKLAFYHRRRRS